MRVGIDHERGDAHGRNVWRTCDFGSGRETLSIDGGAVWYRCHAYQRFGEHRVDRSCRYVHPESRFEVNANRCTICMSGGGIGYVANGLYVRHAIKEDIVLLPFSSIRHAAEGTRKRQSFLRKVEFQNVVAGWVDWFRERCRRWRSAIRTKNQIEASPSKCSGEVRQYTQWYLHESIRYIRARLELAVNRMDLEAGCKRYGSGSSGSCGGGVFGGHVQVKLVQSYNGNDLAVLKERKVGIGITGLK